MPIELFGFSLGRKRKSTSTTDLSAKADQVGTFVKPDLDYEGSTIIDSGAGYFGTYMDMDGSEKTDIDFIKKYREMATHPEVESAVEDICNESIVHVEDRRNVDINLEMVDLSSNIKKRITEEYDNVYSLLNFENKGFEIFRRWYVDGKLYYHMVVDPKKTKSGVLDIKYIDPTKIRKVVEVKKEHKNGVDTIVGSDEYFLYKEKPEERSSGGIRIAPEAVCYATSGLFDAGSKRVISYLHKAIKPLNQLRMIEDAVVIYRISRAPERRIFYIDVGSLPKTKAEQYVRSIMNKYRNKLVYDAKTGAIRDDKRHLSMLEDFWLPRREGGKGTEISTLDGGQNLGEMEDVFYFQKRLFQSLGVPKSRLEQDVAYGMGRASEINRDEVKFMKFIDRLRSKFNEVFKTLLKTQCILKGVMTEEEWNNISESIKFDYARDNHFAELKDYEILNERMSILRDVNDYIGKYYSVEWVRKNILRQSEREIEEMDSQISREREDGIITDDGNEGY
tara:strand:- start:2307 stop:3824 length:1518 start_codon:yes stop_codon:yes gene_type:complete